MAVGGPALLNDRLENGWEKQGRACVNEITDERRKEEKCRNKKWHQK